MSESYINFESYPPLFRPPPNSPSIQESDKTEPLLLDSATIPVIDYFKCTTTTTPTITTTKPVIDYFKCTTTTTPTITTTKYEDVDDDDDKYFCRRNLISEACRDWGLFRLVNHGIPFTLLNQIEEYARKLFSLPYETKKGLFIANSSNIVSPISYFWGTPALTPFGAALAQKKGPQENKQSLQWMEGFNVSLAQLSNIQYQDLLLESFRCLLEEYGKEQARVATEIFKILGPFDSNYLSIETGILRVYRYPRCLEPERTWGIDVHTDSSLISIIHQDDVGGLQVYNDHQWIDVNPLPNTLIVNIGDMLQAISDDRYMSVKHRVKVNKHKERISIGYFVFPAEDTIIQSTKYNPFSYADFRAQVQHDLKTVGLKTGLQKFKSTTDQNYSFGTTDKG